MTLKPDPSHEVAYLAGFIDGEGCIRIMCNRAPLKIGQSPVYRLLLAVTQRSDHMEPLTMLKARYGGWVGKMQVKAGCKSCHSWQVAGTPAAIAITDMLPYLRVKRIAAYTGLAFHHFKEVMRATRTGQRLSEFELEASEGFTKAFYIINGNKPLTEGELVGAGLAQPEALAQVEAV